MNLTVKSLLCYLANTQNNTPCLCLDVVLWLSFCFDICFVIHIYTNMISNLTIYKYINIFDQVKYTFFVHKDDMIMKQATVCCSVLFKYVQISPPCGYSLKAPHLNLLCLVNAGFIQVWSSQNLQSK